MTGKNAERPRWAARHWEGAVLVLSRKETESLVFPDQDIEVAVLEIRGDRVRLGITAPDSIRCFRDEVWARIEPTEDESEDA